jgi:WD repeat-containing protein 61
MMFHASARFTGHQGSIYAIVATGRETFVTAGSEGLLVQWDIRKPAEGELLAKIPGVVYSLLFFETFLLAGTTTGKIHVIDVEKRKELRILQYHQAPVFRIAWNENTRQFISLAGDGVVQIYDDQLNPVKKITASSGKLRSIAFHEDEIAIGTAEGLIKTYSLDLKLKQQWQTHQEGFNVNALYYSGSLLISGSRDAHLNVSDPLSGKLLESIPAHNYAIYTIAAAAGTSGNIATASRDKTIKIWNTDNMQMIQRLDASIGGHANSVNDLVWLDGNTIISAGDDRVAISWKNV